MENRIQENKRDKFTEKAREIKRKVKSRDKKLNKST